MQQKDEREAEKFFNELSESEKDFILSEGFDGKDWLFFKEPSSAFKRTLNVLLENWVPVSLI